MRKLIFMCLLALGTMGQMNAQGMPVYDNTNFISLAKVWAILPAPTIPHRIIIKGV